MHWLSPCLEHQLQMAVWKALVLSALRPEYDARVAMSRRYQAARCRVPMRGCLHGHARERNSEMPAGTLSTGSIVWRLTERLEPAAAAVLKGVELQLTV